MLKVVGTHKQEVGPQVVIAQSQQIDVAGDQIENVYGNQTMKVGTNRVVHITGTEKRTVDGNCDWFKHGKNFSMYVGFEESIKIANSMGLTIGAKQEANIAATETLNVAGSAEQTFAIKNVINYGLVKETTSGVKIVQNNAVEKTTFAIDQTDTELCKEVAKMRMEQNKITQWGSKIFCIK